MTPCVWRNSATRALYFTQPPNLSTAAHRNQKCTEFGMTAFGCNRMSIENAHLCTFGTETETKAEIRSTSTVVGRLYSQQFKNIVLSRVLYNPLHLLVLFST